MTDYKYLFRPLSVGHTVLKNRIICGPHVTNFWPDHLPDERTTAYYEERAAGGVAMIIIGASPVDETAKHRPFMQCGLWNDDCIPGLRDIAEAVHRHDSKLSIQLAQPGIHQTPGDYEEWPLVAPSQIPAVEAPFRIPRELEADDIRVIADKYADAAERAQKAGLDGVEFHGGHGYLLWSFVTPIKNKRTDEYGGSFENRMRFFLEVIDKVRTRVGKDFIVGCRISSSDMAPGGMEPEDVAEVAKALEATGQIDYIHCSLGLYRSAHYMVPSHYSGLEPGYQGDLTGQVKAALKTIPMFLVGRINDPMLADQLIADGAADACVLVRELLAEPEFANLAEQGRIDDIRPCAYWNQGCVSRIFLGFRAGCQMNGATGHELEFGKKQLRPTAAPKHMLVVGGGPAGLEFARIAAARGHRVTLHERSNALAGQARLFARLPGRSEVRNWIDWLVRQVDGHAGIEIRLGSELNSGNIDAILEAAHAGEIVIASGARAAADGRSGITTEPIPGHDRPHVLTYEHVLSDSVPDTVGDRVLIIDELADRIAPGIAEMLAESGHEVEIVTRWTSIGHEFLPVVLETPFFYEKLDVLNVKRTTDTWIASIGEGSATAFNIYSGRDWEIAADTVVLVTTKYSNIEIGRLIKQRASVPVHVIGDALAPRQVGDAVQDATRLAHRL
jgi:2,4-dienoyl-CoA reductase-like NADH-dependent reductase (Old Yellow Enzyme family)